MKITLTNAGKRFNRDWIFRNVNYEFAGHRSYAVVGPNGSGKSTLLQIIAGSVGLSEGKIEYSMGDGQWSMDKPRSLTENISDKPVSSTASAKSTADRSDYTKGAADNPDSGQRTSDNGHSISTENIYQSISLAAPYLELIEEMTLQEFLAFHGQFKSFLDGISIEQIIHSVQLTSAKHKQIRYFSSGMKQRIKLAQAIFSKTPLLLLDEPCTNLDEDGIAIYLKLIEQYGQKKLIIVSSNERQEYSFCKESLDLRNYK
jgi:ABC-type multidrug transport system ATPase subunit